MIECISYCSTQTPQSQIDALTDLYTSTNGPSWTIQTNWLEGDPCSNQWFGVYCNNASSVFKKTFVASLFEFNYLLIFFQTTHIN